MKEILVVGDSMLDLRIDCEVNRLSPEAPVPIYELLTEERYLGGAANVAMNIARMGSHRVTLLTAFGQDHDGNILNRRLASEPITLRNTGAEGTTTKTRIVVGGVVRVRLDNDWVLEEEESAALTAVAEEIAPRYDIIVFSDYGKGALRDVQRILRVCKRRTTIVDPKGRNWDKYAGAHLIKANAAEMLDVDMPATHALRKFNLEVLIETAGAAGSIAHSADGYSIPVRALPVDCVDPTGAGDSYLAALTVQLANGASLERATHYASVAGALATTAMGTKIVTREEIEEWLPRLTTI